MLKTMRKGTLGKTTKEYASTTTIHGIGYVFDKGTGRLDRVLWLLVVLALSGVMGYFTGQIWLQWREEQVIHFNFHNQPPV